jgi:hypothetical protein
MATWVDRILAAIGLGGRKAESDVSYDPAQEGPRQDKGTADQAMRQQYIGQPGKDAGDTGPAAAPGGP